MRGEGHSRPLAKLQVLLLLLRAISEGGHGDGFCDEIWFRNGFVLLELQREGKLRNFLREDRRGTRSGEELVSGADRKTHEHAEGQQQGKGQGSISVGSHAEREPPDWSLSLSLAMCVPNGCLIGLPLAHVFHGPFDVLDAAVGVLCCVDPTLPSTGGLLVDPCTHSETGNANAPEPQLSSMDLIPV